MHEGMKEIGKEEVWVESRGGRDVSLEEERLGGWESKTGGKRANALMDVSRLCVVFIWFCVSMYTFYMWL